MTGQRVLNNSVFISGTLTLENNLQRVWSRMSEGKPANGFHLFLNNKLKPLEIRTQALNATFHPLLSPRHCLSKNFSMKGFELALAEARTRAPTAFASFASLNCTNAKPLKRNKTNNKLCE